MKSIYILKAHFSGYKPTANTKNRVLVKKIDFLCRWGGDLKVFVTDEAN